MEKKIQKKRKYIKEIDGLRALAVIMVLAYHLKMPFAKSGLLGVTVFFVISGYLITGILINEIEESGGVDLKNFWLRRIRSIFICRFQLLHDFCFVIHAAHVIVQ